MCELLVTKRSVNTGTEAVGQHHFSTLPWYAYSSTSVATLLILSISMPVPSSTG
jgi:hypothetical protein